MCYSVSVLCQNKLLVNSYVNIYYNSLLTYTKSGAQHKAVQLDLGLASITKSQPSSQNLTRLLPLTLIVYIYLKKTTKTQPWSHNLTHSLPTTQTMSHYVIN